MRSESRRTSVRLDYFDSFDLDSSESNLSQWGSGWILGGENN